MRVAKGTLPLISENQRANNSSMYYRSDDPNVVMEVRTIITEVHLDLLENLVAEKRAMLDAESMVMGREQLQAEYELQAALLGSIAEEA